MAQNNRLLRPTKKSGGGGPIGPPPPAVTYRILTELSANLCAENGNVLRKEQNT
jgi:hypothetical protein